MSDDNKDGIVHKVYWKKVSPTVKEEWTRCGWSLYANKGKLPEGSGIPSGYWDKVTCEECLKQRREWN